MKDDGKWIDDGGQRSDRAFNFILLESGDRQDKEKYWQFSFQVTEPFYPRIMLIDAHFDFSTGIVIKRQI